MATTAASPAPAAKAASRVGSEPAYDAFLLLRTVFTIAPIVFGLDKFVNVLTDWPDYLAGWMNGLIPGDAQMAMYMVGVVEIIAGLLVAVAPRFGGYVVALWLAGIIVNLLTLSGFYDVALRDFGLLVAALALARLSVTYDVPRGRRQGNPGHVPSGR